MLLYKRWQLRGVRSLAQYRDEAEALTIMRIAHQAKTNLSIDPSLDAEVADIDDHGGGMGNGFFESCDPGVARLETVLVEPDVKAVAAEHLPKLASRLRVRTGVA